MCGDTPLPNVTCQMLTPSLNCGTYSVMNLTGSTIDSGSLTVLNTSLGIYYFNVTLAAGDYEASLCDNTTREFTVTPYQEELSNMYVAMIIGVLGVAFALFYAGNSLSKEHSPMKLLFLIIGLVLLLTTLALSSGLLGGDLAGLETITGGAYKGFIFVMVVAVAYFIIYFMKQVLESIKAR